MKTSIFKLQGFILTIGLLLISFTGYSQDVKQSKEERKEAKRDRQYYNFQVMDTLIQNKNFVLQADYLQNEFGFRRHVLSGLNFIMVDSLKAVLQTGSNAYMGYNGVGGATAEGSIQGLKIVKDLKHLTLFLRFTVMSNIGIYDVEMTVYSNSLARATISGLTPGKLTYEGRISSIYDSGIYKGWNSI